jgi:Bacterial Ig-like domain
VTLSPGSPKLTPLLVKSLSIVLLLLSLASAQAASAAVYQVPENIPDDCSVAVESQIMSWLATVPDGNTARFSTGACYGQDGTIALNGRSDLVLDGQGSEFRALTPGDSHRANWRFTGGANLRVENMAARGANPQGGYQAGFEWQHGFSVEGVQGMTLADVQARETWGDGVYMDHGASSPACGDDASSARDVVVTGATLERIGRQGVAVVDAENVTVEDSAIGPVALANVDIETDDDCAIARHITIARNQFGAHTWGVVDSVGFGADPQVGDVTVTDNTQSVAAPSCFAAVRILSPVVPEGQPPVYRNGYTFSGNRLLGTRNGFELRGVRNVQVSSNDVPLPPTVGCGKRSGVLLVDSHDVAITSNSFIGANNVFKADLLSTGITAEGNTTVDTVAPETSIGSGPEGSVSSSSASFGFGADEAGVTFECRLDAGAFGACSSPKDYAGLSEGPHTFEVRATDAAGNTDGSPAGRTWTVDTVAPSLTLDEPAPGSTTTEASPTVSGTAGSQPGDSATVTVKIWAGSTAEGSPLQTKTTGRDPVSGAYSLAADALADGTYTARAEQSDAAGNGGQSGAGTFTVDATPPEKATFPAAPPLVLLPDLEPPAVVLGGRRTQRAGASIKVSMRPTSESVWATASGKLAVRGSRRTYRLASVASRFIPLGQRATLRLALSKNALSAARRALSRHREVRAELRLSARDAAGNSTTRKRTIELEL